MRCTGVECIGPVELGSVCAALAPFVMSRTAQAPFRNVACSAVTVSKAKAKFGPVAYAPSGQCAVLVVSYVPAWQCIPLFGEVWFSNGAVAYGSVK